MYTIVISNSHLKISSKKTAPNLKGRLNHSVSVQPLGQELDANLMNKSVLEARIVCSGVDRLVEERGRWAAVERKAHGPCVGVLGVLDPAEGYPVGTPSGSWLGHL